MTLIKMGAQMKIDITQGVATQALKGFGLIRVTGNDARDFLHKQLTQEVLALTDDQTKLAGYCSAKGRLYAVMQIFATSDAVYLLTRKTLVDLLIKRLRLFVLRAQVVFEDVSEQYQVFARLANDALGVGCLHVDGEGVRLGLLPSMIEGALYRREFYIQEIGRVFKADLSLVDESVWDWLDVRAALPRVELETVEGFVPQMINLDRVGGVNFKKGCYPGQEIVARSHYLGKLKRRMQMAQLIFATPELAQEGLSYLNAGCDVFASSDPTQAVGQVVLSAAHPNDKNRVDVLYEIDMTVLSEKTQLSVTHVQAQWLPEDLPYLLTDKA